MHNKTFTAQDLGYRLVAPHQLGQSSMQPDRYGILHYGPFYYPLVYLAGAEFHSGCLMAASGAAVAFSSEAEVRRFCASRNRSEAQRVRHASRRFAGEKEEVA